MSYFFDVYGPFSVNRNGRDCPSAQRDLWHEAEQRGEGVSSAIGCYMFCISHGNTITPWYVGMTAARTGFRGEVFTSHKIGIYNECLNSNNGNPVVFLFPLCSNGRDRFSRAYSSGRRVIEWLERMLMGFAYARNPAMSNTRGMHFLKNTTVLGVFGEKRRGRPYAEVKEACAALFGRSRSTSWQRGRKQQPSLPRYQQL
jgi:hypothetical protein